MTLKVYEVYRWFWICVWTRRNTFFFCPLQGSLLGENLLFRHGIAILQNGQRRKEKKEKSHSEKAFEKNKQ